MSGLFRRKRGEDGTIKGISFETKTWNEGEENEHTTLTARVDFLPDGGDEAVPRFLRAGFLNDGMSVTDDGTLVFDGEDVGLSEDTEFARFILSMIEQGFSESELKADDFSAIVGTRVRLTQWVDEEATKKFGLRKGKGKNKGKEFKRTETRVAMIYGREVSKDAKKSAAKTAKSGAKDAAKTAPADTARADAVLLELLSSVESGTIERGKFSALIVRYALTNKLAAAEREELRKILTDEDYLKSAEERGIITYAADSKKQEIKLAA